MAIKDTKTPDNMQPSIESEKSKAKQSRLALIAGLTVIFGIVLIIVMIFMQKSQIEENNVTTNIAMDELQDNVDKLDTSTTDLKTQLEAMLSQLNSMDSIIQNNKDTVESINVAANKSGENIASAEEDIKALQKTLNDYISKFEEQTTNTNTEVKKQFETVNNDITKMLEIVNDNNKVQSDNYKELSKQMEKTLKDINSFVNNLSDENKKQYAELTEQVTSFQTDLDKYLKNFESALNTTISNKFKELNAQIDVSIKELSENTSKSFEDTKKQLETTTNLLSETVEELNNANVSQYEDLSQQITDTNKNLENLITALSKQEDEHYKDVIETLNSQNDELNLVIETKFNQLNATLQEDVDGINTHLDTVQNDINDAKNDIQNLLNDIDKNQTADIKEKFDTIQGEFETIKNDFDSTLSKIEGLIAALSKQNEEEHAETIKKLTDVKNNLTDLNTQMSEDLNNQLTNMQADYTQQIGDLQKNVTTSLDKQTTSITNSLDTNINNQTTSLTNSLNNNNEEIKRLIESTNDKVDDYKEAVDQSFTSVRNTKKLLVYTLLTYKANVAEGTEGVPTFQQIADAIKLLGTKSELADIVIQEVTDEDNITEDKIMAGKSVTKSRITNNNGTYSKTSQTVNGTATSDANAEPSQILENYSGYVNGQKVDGTMKNHGAVSVNFTKAVQQATLDSGYYDGITIDIKDLYNIGYTDGIKDADKTINYSTVVISPGTHGKFTSDNSTESKTFTGPSYSGFTMDVTPIGVYKLSGWDTTLSNDGTIYMTAHWVKNEKTSTTIKNFNDGSYYFGKDYVTSITLTAHNSAVKGTYDGRGGRWTDNPNQISNETRTLTAFSEYDLYVNGKYWKTISCSNTFTGLGTKSEVEKMAFYDTFVYSYYYKWEVDATNTITFDEPVRYLTIKEKSVSSTSDVTIERYLDE